MSSADDLATSDAGALPFLCVEDEMKEVSHDMMKPGHLLEYRCPKFGIVFQWRVLGIYLGTARQEGLVEIEPVLQSPGTDSRGELHERMMVPEPMTRRLTIIAPGINPKQETQP